MGALSILKGSLVGTGLCVTCAAIKDRSVYVPTAACAGNLAAQLTGRRSCSEQASPKPPAAAALTSANGTSALLTMLVSPQNSHVETSLIVFGGGTLEK